MFFEQSNLSSLTPQTASFASRFLRFQTFKGLPTNTCPPRPSNPLQSLQLATSSPFTVRHLLFTIPNSPLKPINSPHLHYLLFTIYYLLMRLWYMNADFEMELAANNARYKCPPNFLSINRRLAQRLLWLSSPGDALLIDPPWSPELFDSAKRREVELVSEAEPSRHDDHTFTP